MSPRKYEAPRRLEQANATRAAIISAAARLFAERGYGPTTMAAIAAEARVSAKSVYMLGDKAQMLRWALDTTIAGDDQPTVLAERPEMQAILRGTSGREKARLAAAMGAPMLVRMYPLYRAFEQAAGVDEEVAALWRDYQERRRQDARQVVLAVEEVATLRPGFDTDRATDTLWALLGWHPVALLIEERGWTVEQIQAWLEDIFMVVLIGHDGRATE